MSDGKGCSRGFTQAPTGGKAEGEIEAGNVCELLSRLDKTYSVLGCRSRTASQSPLTARSFVTVGARSPQAQLRLPIVAHGCRLRWIPRVEERSVRPGLTFDGGGILSIRFQVPQLR